MMATTSDMNGIPELPQRHSRVDHPINGIISDLDGVAYRDDHPIPASVQAFRAWHERGVPYAFVTNNSTKSAAQFATKLSGMGIPATASQVFNTISAATILLQQRWPPGTPVFAIGEQPLLEALEQAGYHLTGTNPQGVVLGYDPCVGVLTAAVTAAVPTAVPIVVGKPHPFMIEQALKHLGTGKQETVMIGDQIATDIVAGQSAGLRAILLASDVPFNALTGVVPDRIISNLLDLVGAVSEETAAV